ncbi:hypothetical protein HanPI659440_Chr08g0279521 [Helianthus annuus]|nr:hypothetical protein HanPI659440_Chr08g0279521 [Helianthus annuus]
MSLALCCTLCVYLCDLQFFVIVFYVLRFTNRVLSYYMFPPVARRRNTRRAKS